MKKSTKFLMFILGSAMLLGGCGNQSKPEKEQTEAKTVKIQLSDAQITVDGENISAQEDQAVYTANDIVFYLEGQGISYGKGSEEDEHSQEEADAHTVVHITKPGTYEISGKLSKGQIAVDLGEDAEEDPEAVVNLILNNAEIQCEVAPAIIFYEVYECADTEEDHAVKEVDTKDAGANLILAEGSENLVKGSYVAKIYKSCTLSEDGTEVIDAKKLHKYDGTIHSKMSMNVSGSGSLEIQAENEGLCSDLHMTMESGNIQIFAGNDGINTSEDNQSVFTMNGGNLQVCVTGTTGEGDGIDSNGWIVINGGTIHSEACSFSADSGLDSDLGIYIYGGSITASGNMLDEISNDSTQKFHVFQWREKVEAGSELIVKDAKGQEVKRITLQNACTNLVISEEDLTEESYTLWKEDQQIAVSSQETGRFGGSGEPPEGMTPGEPPEGMTPGELPEGMTPGEPPEGMKPGEPPEGMEPRELPAGAEPGELPEGMKPVEMPEDFQG